MASNILIIGATGAIGKPITTQIFAAKATFGRIAILTSPNTVATKAAEIEALKKQGAVVLVGDLAVEDDVKKAYEGIDVVVSCVGRGAILTQIPLIKWASESGVSRFFPSEYGTDIEHNAASVNEKPHQLKIKVRAFAKEIENVKFTYLVTGPYSDMYMAKSGMDEIGTWDVKGRRAVLLGTGTERVAFTTMIDVGKLVVAALQHPVESANKIFIVNSFTATQNQILAEFEKQTGSKWNVSYVSLDKLKEIEKEAWETGKPYATGATLKRIWTEGGTLYPRDRDNGVIGGPPMEDLKWQVAEVIAAQMKA